MKSVIDFAIIGGGLSGCLTYLALKNKNPRLNIHLFEKNSKLCGNHTWCFHDSDIPDGAAAWLKPLISQTWNEQEVHFPEYSRVLNTPYHCIRAHDLDARTRDIAGHQLHLETDFEKVVETPEGLYELYFKGMDQPILAHSYLYARGWKPVEDPKSAGWQKFVGLEVKLTKPHGLTRVTLKDVRQPQIDGYRFFYVLPFNETEMLIEDTYYSNHSGLKIERIEREVMNYAQKQGWEVERVLRRETGALPLFLKMPNVARGDAPEIGAESMFVHPVTGYSLPMTLRMIQNILDQSNLTTVSLKKVFRKTWDREKSKIRYLILLNRMMFLAAKNETRYKILERFYTFPEAMIDRFYAGKLTWYDRVRILSGKPPVPVGQAMKALRGP